MRVKYEYVQSMGGIWRLNPSQFKLLQQVILSGKEFNLDNFGKMITDNLHELRYMEAAARDTRRVK